MLQRFFPKEEQESTYLIDFATYYERGFRGVIFDIDNTLVFHNAPATEQAKGLFASLRALGMKTMLLSNNKEPRVKAFAEQVESPYIFRAAKPSRKGYLLSAERMGLSPEQVLFVGDQLFTDVWGANRAGLYSILVKPLNPKEEIQIVLKRLLEKPVIKVYEKRKRYGN